VGRSNKIDRNSKRSYEKAIWQEKKNPQGLKAGDNVWLEAKNIHSNRSSKKLNLKKYEPFRISKNIGQGVF